MTITLPPLQSNADDRLPLRPVALDLYIDIHKGIRAELFAVTETAGSMDPSDRNERVAITDHVRRVVAMLETHAAHEDVHIGPAMQRFLPELAARVETDHANLDSRVGELLGRAAETIDTRGDVRWHTHKLYVELASFTSDYLAHQDMEERIIMPALEDAIGPDAVLTIHEAIVGSIPPDELARSLAFMLPAMNVDDRTDMLGGMQAGAPPEVFAGIWELARSVLAPADVEALAARLGL